MEGVGSGFWTCPSFARKQLLPWQHITEDVQLNVRLVDLSVKCPVSFGLFEVIVNACVSTLRPEDFCAET